MIPQAGFALRGRNPDVLTCIANLSNDEVFTPPEFANRMLDTLAEAWAANNKGANIWTDKTVKFLDPCTKSGVFLREITSRLTKGLEQEIPDLEKCVNHILTRQVFGIGITQITSLLARRSVYCSKHAKGKHSIAKSFTSDDGNIWFKRLKHTWDGDKCKYCGAGKSVFNRAAGLETHAYAFIHTDNIKTQLTKIFGGNMQFDVIIGNPPYQLASDGGTRDIPIYNKFVEQAKKLEPRYLSMVIPSRWMASGLGLSDFRKSMLEDRHIRKLMDYERMDLVFPGVDFEGGICYFLWDRDNAGKCEVTTVTGEETIGPMPRDLNEYDVLVRDSRGLNILKKVLAPGEPSIIDILSADKEFGWTSNFEGFREKKKANDVALYYGRAGKRLVGGIARKDITKSPHLIDKWKVMVSAAYGERGARPAMVLGPSFIAESPSVCTQTYLFFYVGSKKQAESLQSYLNTRLFRFLVSLRKITQHATRATYTWIPQQRWDRLWTDEALYKKYRLSKADIAHIEACIRPRASDDE
ncbi:MAG: Eco57I restriction-modification methylase domain-containing protein [Verrucomicrobiae bacterium]|nr:Eco57I restriction-modification methylase domain-containing protein [Verrucomicrobiae bacterium]